jgi:hypothetical protein
MSITSGFVVNAHHFSIHEGQFVFGSCDDFRVSKCDSPFSSGSSTGTKFGCFVKIGQFTTKFKSKVMYMKSE